MHEKDGRSRLFTLSVPVVVVSGRLAFPVSFAGFVPVVAVVILIPALVLLVVVPPGFISSPRLSSFALYVVFFLRIHHRRSEAAILCSHAIGFFVNDNFVYGVGTQ